jgi:hypothetical protein
VDSSLLQPRILYLHPLVPVADEEEEEEEEEEDSNSHPSTTAWARAGKARGKCRRWCWMRAWQVHILKNTCVLIVFSLFLIVFSSQDARVACTHSEKYRTLYTAFR